MRCSYKYEFPDFDFEIPDLEGFTDNSWHNDICPSFVRQLNDTQEIVVWVNYANKKRRECGGRQFVVVVKDIEDYSLNFTCEIETNSWGSVLKKIKILEKFNAYSN